MKNKTKLIITVLTLIILISGATILYNTLSDKVDSDKLANEESGKVPAVDFTVYDNDGTPVKLSDYLGKKPVVISFWASWCGVCKAEMPDIDTVYNEMKDKVQFMMINVTDGTQETKETANEFLDGVDYTFPVFYDTTLEAGMKYGANALPTTFFIDSDGYVTSWANYLDLETLRKAVGAIAE